MAWPHARELLRWMDTHRRPWKTVGAAPPHAFSRLAVGHLGAMLFAAAGLTGFADVLPPSPATDVGLTALNALASFLLAPVMWWLPWERWPRWASLCIVPVAFALIGLGGVADPNPYTFALPFISVFLWLGVTHRRGTSIVALPLALVAYLAPLQLAPGPAAGVLGSALFAMGVCGVLGETLAWVMLRLSQTQSRLADELAALHVQTTERSRVQVELQTERDFAQQVMSSMGQGLAVSDNELRFVYVNPALATMLGAPAETLLGKYLWYVYSAAERERVMAMDPVNWGNQLTLEVDLQGANGRTIGALLTLARRYRGTEREGWIAVVTDLTQRKHMEAVVADARDLALEASRAKSDFLATMSHEIRSPMNGVIGMTALLLDTPLDAQQREYAGAVQRSGEALLTVINDVLDFSKIEAGKVELELREVDVREVAEDVVELFAPHAERSGLAFGCVIDPRIPALLRADAGRLRQVLTNLVANALKFTERGDVVVRLSEIDQDAGRVHLRVEVADTGIGISTEARARLFQPFTQADASTTRKYGGTGLGLAISRRLVELMDGEIGVDSEEGRGSTFWFNVWLVVAAASRAGVPPELDGRRVLIVDEHPVTRTVLRAPLVDRGMTVVEASDGPTALDTLRLATATGQPFDLVLVDRQLSSMDGLRVAQSLYEDAALGGARVILLTAVGHILPIAELESPGVVGCLTRPVRQRRLLEAVTEAILRSRLAPSAPSTPTDDSPSVGESDAPPLLVVDDTRMNQRVAVGLLKKLGYRAEVVASGFEALAAIEHGAYAAVLIDCQMPGMDGYATTRELRVREASDTGGRHIPVIAMTANATTGERERCLEAGMDDYISKPVRLPRLQAVLAQWIGRAA